MTPAARRKGREGMTLLEVMLAVVVLTTGLIALVTAASRCIAVAGQAKNYELARRMMGQVEVESPLWLKDEIEAGSESGTFTDGPKGWSWTRDIENLGEDDETQEGLFKVRTRVLWGGRGGTQFEEEEQYLFVPKNFEGVFTLKPNTI
jgi:hypothetical protein